MKSRIVIVGGGIAGLATAYHLALLGEPSVTLVEQEYLSSGASGRSSTNFRHTFWAPENSRFAVESLKLVNDFVLKPRRDPELFHDGCIYLLYDEKYIDAYRVMDDKVWRPLGNPGKILMPEEISKEHPYLNLEGVVAGYSSPQVFQVNPILLCLNYFEKAKELGVRFLTYTKAEKIIVENNRVVGVQTNKGIIEAEKVLIATGSWSNELLETAHIELPIVVERRELAITERVNLFLKTYFVCIQGYRPMIRQRPTGHLIGGFSLFYPEVKASRIGQNGVDQCINSLEFITACAREMSRVLPVVKHLMFLRVWAGYYAVTPDNSHILGRDPEWPINLYVATGYSGHGFMLGAATGKLMAKNILYDEVDSLMKPFLPTRFKEGKLIHEHPGPPFPETMWERVRQFTGAR